MTEFSICMIVKNEEATLKPCLDALKQLNSEIIVVDTGSTDKTRQIALDAGARIFDFTWVNDFSLARNYSIAQASHDAIICVDSDEILTEQNFKEVTTLYESHPESVGRITRINPIERNGEHLEFVELVARVFSRKHFHYTGRIHEQVTPIKDRDFSYYCVPLSFSHEGYNGTKEFIQQKANRNIALLEEMLKAEEDPYVYYQLGKSYYMKEEYKIACDYFSKGLEFDLNEKLEYVQDMVESYGYALLNTAQYETALCFEGIYDAFAVTSDFVFLMGVIYLNNGLFSEAIEQFLKATSMTNCKIKQTNSTLAYYNIAVIYECLGELDKAMSYYKKCGSYKKAQIRLEGLSK